ncbi:Collectin-11 [Branchiostoma belcheri]|nr:Collectin-11 [Branchiostoma belcheri]
MSTKRLLIDTGDVDFDRRSANFNFASLAQVLTAILTVVTLVLVIHEGAHLTERVAVQSQELSTLKTAVSDYQKEVATLKTQQEVNKNAEVAFLTERLVALEAKLSDGDTNTQSELGDKVDPAAEIYETTSGGTAWRPGAVHHQREKRAANSVTFPTGACMQGPPGIPGRDGRDGIPGRDCPCKEIPTEPLKCPSGYVQFRDKCYQFSTTQKQYNDAMAVCVAAGGHLAVAKDEETDNFLVNEIRKRGNPETWMGMSDQVQEGTWVWEDGSVLSGWTNWLPGQPDSTAEDCAEWKVAYGFKWNDDECYHTQYFVCEINAS